MGKKIREGEKQKTPYLLILGGREEENKTVGVRQRGKGDMGEMKMVEFLEKIKNEINNKDLPKENNKKLYIFFE